MLSIFPFTVCSFSFQLDYTIDFRSIGNHCLVYFDRAITNLCFSLNEYTRHMMVRQLYYINNIGRNHSYKWYYNM